MVSSMTVMEMHSACVAAYKEALEGTEFEGVEITPVDRETQDVHRFMCETDYDASYSREIGLKVTTLDEELYYYSKDSKKWKAELNRFQEAIELRFLKGVGGLEVTDIDCESGRYGDTGGVIRITFALVDYEEVEFDGRNASAEYMEEINESLTIHNT